MTRAMSGCSVKTASSSVSGSYWSETVIVEDPRSAAKS
jgi:hypothetical protein